MGVATPATGRGRGPQDTSYFACKMTQEIVGGYGVTGCPTRGGFRVKPGMRDRRVGEGRRNGAPRTPPPGRKKCKNVMLRMSLSRKCIQKRRKFLPNFVQ